MFLVLVAGLVKVWRPIAPAVIMGHTSLIFSPAQWPVLTSTSQIIQHGSARVAQLGVLLVQEF